MNIPKVTCIGCAETVPEDDATFTGGAVGWRCIPCTRARRGLPPQDSRHPGKALHHDCYGN